MASDGPSFLAMGIPAFLLLAVWLTVAVMVSEKGEDVDKPNRMAHLYGYTVCLISLVVALISLSSGLNACFDRANPLQSESRFGTSLTSFESYKATYRREQLGVDRSEAKPDTMADASLRARYDALVQDRIAGTRYRTAKSLTSGIIFLLISIALFVTHWRWVRRLNGVAHGAV